MIPSFSNNSVYKQTVAFIYMRSSTRVNAMSKNKRNRRGSEDTRKTLFACF